METVARGCSDRRRGIIPVTLIRLPSTDRFFLLESLLRAQGLNL